MREFIIKFLMQHLSKKLSAVIFGCSVLTVLLWFAKINSSEFIIAFPSLIGAFITGNVIDNRKPGEKVVENGTDKT